MYKIAKCNISINYEFVLNKRLWIFSHDTVKRLRWTIVILSCATGTQCVGITMSNQFYASC